LLSAGMQPVCNKVPMGHTEIELCFPHGCCHIFCDSVRAQAAKVSFSGAYVKTNGSIAVVSDPIQYFSRINNDAFPPVMCYFDPKKNITSGQNFITSQKNRLDTLIADSKNIAIVGVSVRPHDKHIWTPLINSEARLLYCSGEIGAKEFNAWKSQYRSNANDVTIPGYFQDSFDAICDFLQI
jgi:hypothetical protein